MVLTKMKKSLQDLRESLNRDFEYTQAKRIPKVLGGLGIAIISTNKGVITDKEARKQTWVEKY